MWKEVRSELTRLSWEATPPAQDLLADWSKTLETLIRIRRALGPLSAQDPVAILATATMGAQRTGAAPIGAASLQSVSQSLAALASVVERETGLDPRREVATLNHVAYQLAHWVRVRTTDPRANAWLMAGETALDAAIHAPAASPTGSAGLAAWQDALARVQPHHTAPIVQRSVALGHLAILHAAYTVIEEAAQSGSLPTEYAESLLANMRDLALAHRQTLQQIDGRPLENARADQAVMLRLGTAVRMVTSRPDSRTSQDVRVDALLRSSVGQSLVVANLTASPAAARSARTLNRLSLEFVADPRMLRPQPAAVSPSAQTARTSPAGTGEMATRRRQSHPSIAPGTVLPGPTVLALCRARDLGVAAATALTGDPPPLLQGLAASRWPQLVAGGRQAVTDLVTSVIPMVYAQTRRAWNVDDLRGQLFLELMGAAYRFDPDKIGPEHWPTYAWMILERSRLHGVDTAGVVRRTHTPGPAIVPIADLEPTSRDPAPSDRLEQEQSVAALWQAIRNLPNTLQAPLLQSIQGRPAREVAQDAGISERTARRRISEARAALREAGVTHTYEDLPTYHPVSPTSPLERSQRASQEVELPSQGPELPPALDR